MYIVQAVGHETHIDISTCLATLLYHLLILWSVETKWKENNVALTPVPHFYFKSPADVLLEPNLPTDFVD